MQEEWEGGGPGASGELGESEFGVKWGEVSKSEAEGSEAGGKWGEGSEAGGKWSTGMRGP